MFVVTGQNVVITTNRVVTALTSIAKMPREGPGVKSRKCPPYLQRVVKGD